MKRQYGSLLVLCAWLFCVLWVPRHAAGIHDVQLARMFALPAPGLWFGADELGRAIAPRVLAGAAVSVPLAAGIVAASLLFGSFVGILGGWSGAISSRIIVAVMDLFQAFPGLLLAIAFAGILGPGLGNVALALALVSWVSFARLARAQTVGLRYREHVLAARALGTPTYQILIRHVAPLLVGPLLVEATFSFATTITAEAGMSFLGLGAQPPTATWGNMLREATQFMLIAPHMIVGPGLALLSLVTAIQIFGERLRRGWRGLSDLPIERH